MRERLVSLLIIVLAVSPMIAQEQRKPPRETTQKAAQSTRPVLNRALTLQEAVEIALKESPVVRGAEEEVNAAIARVGIARAGSRPVLSTTGFLTTGSEGSIYATPAPVMPQNLFAVPRSSFFDLNAMLMVPLYTGGRLKALIRQAQSTRGASEAELQAVKRDLALEVKTTYRQVLLTQSTEEIFKSLAETNRERLRIDRVAFEVGRIPKFYVLRDEAELANTEQMLVNTQRDVSIAFVMLKTAMGISPASEISLSDKLGHELPLTPSLSPRRGERGQGEGVRDELLKLAEKQRSELIAARNRVDAAHSGVSAARSAYKPQFSLSAMADTMRARGSPQFTGATVGVVVGLPLFDGGLRRAQVGEATALQRKAQQDFEKIALQVIQDVDTALLSVQAAERNIDTAKTALLSAEENYRVAQVRYESGRGINVEVLDALTAFTRARTNHIQALYEYSVARDQLLRAVGQQ